LELKKDKNITIKKADKNAGIVILNTIDYLNKINVMLSDSNTYTVLDADNTSDIKEQADKILQNFYKNNYITFKQLKNLTYFSAVSPIFYGIPKVHKVGTPLRPIVSQINGPTYKINKYLHELLLVAEAAIPYLFKDTTAFLNTIEKHKYVQNSTLLVTMDVVSLYTNIPHDEAITYITEQYQNTIKLWPNYHTTVKPIPVQSLRILLTFCLQNCEFTFNNTFYKQNYGLPMGAPAAVRVANIFMYKHITKFISNYNSPLPIFFGRLIDDIFFTWSYSESQLHTLHNNLNNFHSTIKFELNYSAEKINFLDTTVYIENNFLHTTLYIKPTDKKEYLHFNSCHPSHTKLAIPYSQAVRYRRIIDDDLELTRHLNTLQNKFLRRQYPPNIVKSHIDKITALNRVDTLKYKTITDKKQEFKAFTNNKPFLPLIITYNHRFDLQKSLRTTLKELWERDIIHSDEIKHSFKDLFPKIIYKKGTTISNKLINIKGDTENNSHLDNLDQQNIRILTELLVLNSNT